MDLHEEKQLEYEDQSSIKGSETNTTILGFDNKSLIFVSDQPYFRARDQQSELSDDLDYVSGFLTNQNTSFQDSHPSSFASRISSNQKPEKSIVPKIPLQQNLANEGLVILEADETITFPTEQTISSMNDDQKEEVYLKDFHLKWSDLVGVDEQKKAIYAMIMMPLKLPAFFKKIPPTNTLLLYGPKNCGKASIIKSMSNEFKEIKVIYAKASLLLNKRNGEEFIDPKKVIKEVQKHKKVLIFIENIDEIFGYKETVPDSDDHMIIQSQECASYLLTTLQEVKNKRGVFIYASSQCPWRLNVKIQNFFQKTIGIRWPNKETKQSLIKKLLSQLQMSEVITEGQIQNISASAKRYSCKEIEVMINKCYEICQNNSKFNIKIMQDEKVLGYSLFNRSLPKHEDFLEYIKNNTSELMSYDKDRFSNYEEERSESMKTLSQKRDEMLKI